MQAKQLAETIISDNNALIDKINHALIDVNGRKYLPLWIEEFSNGRLENLSADTLQGIKLALFYSTTRMKKHLDND